MAQKMELLPKAKQPGIYPGQKRKKPSKYAKFRNPGELFRVKGKVNTSFYVLVQFEIILQVWHLT